MEKLLPEISIILPCRNEELALESCILQIRHVIKTNKLNAEVIISDSSSDSSPNIAKKYKTLLVKHDKPGYGIAYLEAFKHAKGKYIFMADADGSYDFNEIPKFIQYLKQGFDLVIGNRFSGNIEKNAMPWTHRYIGNPILSLFLRIMFSTNIRDAHCGIRAISKRALDALNLRTTGMEFASEMIIKAAKKHLKIKQLPVSYKKRQGKSKLKTMSDGWRHLRFMLIYSPNFIFLIPGIILFFLGSIVMLLISFNTITILGQKLQEHPMFIASALMFLGYQLILFHIFSKSYAMNHLGEESQLITNLSKLLSLERIIILGALIMLAGAIGFLLILNTWISQDFGELQQIKTAIASATFIILGIQTIFSAFMLSILSIKEK